MDPSWEVVRPPRETGWESADLDVINVPPHTEVLRGRLFAALLPQRRYHRLYIHELLHQLERQTGAGFIVEAEMTATVNKRNRPEPDLLVIRDRPEYEDLNIADFKAEDVTVVVEVESPATADVDRNIKPGVYAMGGIEWYVRVWRDETGNPWISVSRLENGEYREISSEQGVGTLDLDGRPVVLRLGQ
ncbi:Uma2 family endonuclease [Salininema proteolyticum]|uniref:Uma2 family endonuclease n=1 Tax=Salininema proteolyticum TaxID=1607685 RepID=A0ABV8TSC2_9ACTN